MDIKIVEPPPNIGPWQPRSARKNYIELAAALSTTDQWIRVPLCELSGTTRLRKANAAHQVAEQIGIRVRTHLDGDYLMIQRVG
jgi:hypothetical protein